MTSSGVSYPTDDLTVAISSFLITSYSYTIASHVLSSQSLPFLSKLPASRREKLSIEFAQLPVRLFLLITNFHTIVYTLSPRSTWTPHDTTTASVSWMALSAAYAWEMYHSYPAMKTSNIIHHLVVFWVKLYVVNRRCSTDTPEDALMLRYIALFLWFMVSLGGILVSGFLLLYFGFPQRTKMQIGDVDVSVPLVMSVVTWAISIRAITCWACVIGLTYMERSALTKWFGIWTWASVVLLATIFWMQWSYNFTFASMEGKRLRATTEKKGLLEASFKARGYLLHGMTIVFIAAQAYFFFLGTLPAMEKHGIVSQDFVKAFF